MLAHGKPPLLASTERGGYKKKAARFENTAIPQLPDRGYNISRFPAGKETEGRALSRP